MTHDVVYTKRTDNNAVTWTTDYDYRAYNDTSGHYDGAFMGGAMHLHSGTVDPERL